MKALLLLISLFFVTTEAFGGLPPTTLRGQTQGTKTTTFNFEVPSNLTTKTSTGTLIELADMNQLVNPSFSASTFSSSWTKVDTSGSASISAEPGYKLPTTAQSYRLNMTTWVGTVCGSILTGAPWPKQSVASMWVAVSGAHTGKVCSRVDGVIQDCANLTSDLSNETFIEYVIPTVTTGSTAEVCYVQDVAASDVVWIGKASLGAMPSTMSPEVAQAQLAGSSYFAGTTNCTLTRTSTTIGAFSADADCPGPTTELSTVGSWQATDSDLIRQTINSLPPGNYVARFILGNTVASPANTSFAINDGTTTCTGVVGNSQSNPTGFVVDCPFSYTLSGNRSFELYGASAASTITLQMAQTSPAAGIRFQLFYYPPASKIYSQACNDPRQCENVFSANLDSAGTVSGENLDFINGNAASGGTGIKTVTWNTGIFTADPNCVLTVVGGSSASNELHIEISASSSTSLTYETASTGADANFAAKLVCQKSPPDYKAQNQITGTFANVVTAPGISKPKTCYYAFGGAGSLSSQTLCNSSPCTEYYDSCGAISSIPRSALGDYTFTFAAGTFAASTFVSCDCVSNQGGVNDCHAYSTSTSAANGSYGGVAYVTGITGVARDGIVVGYCTGQAP